MYANIAVGCSYRQIELALTTGIFAGITRQRETGEQSREKTGRYEKHDDGLKSNVAE